MMKNWIKKATLGILIISTLGVAFPLVAEAATVYYNGTPISWNYGRSLGVTSYSTVQSGSYTHSATANTTFSGWKSKGVQAHAQQYVGWGNATAYWNAR